MNLRSLLISFYLLLLIVVVAASGISYWRNDREHRRLLAQEQQVRLRLAEARARLADQERILDRLRNDPAYVETVIRRRLGYAKPGETIFRFEDPPARP
ncbi:MAG: septum formation initiator family protein [Opitutaceae bacterium]|jgi:cell division protein FtsB|nr:septum formation initiator family protein [Opitutaceae bacterium]